MLFNSLSFATFFIIFFIIYWFIFKNNLKLQNLLVLVASYVFYAWATRQFLYLIILSTCITYYLGILIEKSTTQKSKNRLLNLGLLLLVGCLVYFKYTNFLITSINSVAHTNFRTLNILLPLGISFYTFRLISYLFDIKNGKFKPTTDWVIFAAYVSFFPSLISGPIDRPKTLIPQLEKPRQFDADRGIDGLRQILWGLFKKVVIADNCAQLANYSFDTPHLRGVILVVGAFFYTIQIYADFSGYSDMAIGITRLLGFEITRNFNYPFFAQNIADFWRRWHMSLTTWLTDYVFAPLSITFRDYDKNGLIMAILINFTIIGIWHGANWTFVLFGVLHGLYYIPLILKGKLNKKKDIQAGQMLPTFAELRNIIGTFLLVMFTFILFRSADLLSALKYYRDIFSLAPLTFTDINPGWMYLLALVFIIFMMLAEWKSRGKLHVLQNMDAKWPGLIRWSFYVVAVALIMTFTGHEQQFIYFKF